MKIKKNRGPRQPIDIVIACRLAMPNIKRRLENDMGLTNFTLDNLKSKQFFQVYNQWPQEKKYVFINLIGARHNQRITHKWLHELNEKLNKFENA